MNLDVLFGSKTKLAILQFLVFRRQGVSMRAFEAELNYSFPAIKKQIDIMEEAKLILVEKDGNKHSISLEPSLYDQLKPLFLFALKQNILSLLHSYDTLIKKSFFGQVFGNDFEHDLVVIYAPGFDEHTQMIKESLSDIFRQSMVFHIKVVFMSEDEFDRRYRLADKFVLTLMRQASQ
jgi:hypothetical protein